MLKMTTLLFVVAIIFILAWWLFVRANRRGKAVIGRDDDVETAEELTPEVTKEMGSSGNAFKVRGLRQVMRRSREGLARHRYRGLEEAGDFPWRYGQNAVVAMAKDPWWVYTYWEVAAPPGRDLILRVHDLSEGAAPGVEAGRYWDIAIGPDADHWFIDVGKAGHLYCLEIGYRGEDGRFVVLARSNTVKTPRDSACGPSEIETFYRLGQKPWAGQSPWVGHSPGYPPPGRGPKS